jgi:glycogen(starch) synthase
MIKALGKLNQMMKQAPNSRSVIAFFWIPMPNAGLRLDVLENKNYYMHIKNYVDSNGEEILRRMVYDFISKRESVNELFADDFMKEIKKNLAHFERKGDPPLSTHNVNEYGNDIFVAIKEQGLLNRKEDLVKVIVQPVYLDGADGFIDLEYYDALVGCHLGIFPSYYEPYGYTPLESAALGVPSITTDMSGFGRFIKTKNPENKGIIVLDRFHKSEDQVINDLSQMLYDFSHQPHSIRLNCKLKAKSLSAFADWKILCEDYVKAHNLALDKAQARR